jgi:hypothetical protein
MASPDHKVIAFHHSRFWQVGAQSLLAAVRFVGQNARRMIE